MCSGRAPLGPGADMAANRTPSNALAGGFCSGASVLVAGRGEMTADSGRMLRGNSCSAQETCSTGSRNAMSDVKDAAALLKAPSRTNDLARAALASLVPPLPRFCSVDLA